MYKLNVISSFSSAHKLNGYEGMCKNLHGHNWKVRICVMCDTLDEIGMAMDFGIIKTKLNEIMSELDHQYLNDLPAFQEMNPTSENLARYIFEQMGKKLSQRPCEVMESEVWESEKTSVVYGL
ncbi:MAG: 6-carboxytetrahydropterin synthase QueD [Candidatus Cloacimonadaceae bacterium]